MTDKIKLPTSIKISWMTYDIKVMDPDVGAAKNLFGLHDSIEQEILVDISRGWPIALEVLMHEISHGIYEHMSLSDAGDRTEEYMACVTGNGMAQVLLDNPSLVKFIVEVTSEATNDK